MSEIILQLSCHHVYGILSSSVSDQLANISLSPSVFLVISTALFSYRGKWYGQGKELFIFIVIFVDKIRYWSIGYYWLILVWFYSIGFADCCLASFAVPWNVKVIPFQYYYWTGCQLLTPSRNNQPPPSASGVQQFSNHSAPSIHCQSVRQSMLLKSIKIVSSQFSVQLNKKLLTSFAFSVLFQLSPLFSVSLYQTFSLSPSFSTIPTLSYTLLYPLV